MGDMLGGLSQGARPPRLAELCQHADLPLPQGARKSSSARIEQVLLVTADIGEPLGIAEVRGMEF